MINEIFPHRFSNQFVVVSDVLDDDYVLHYQNGALLLKCNGDGYELPRKSDVYSSLNFSRKTFMFSLNDVRCFLVWSDTPCSGFNLSYVEVSLLRTLQPQEVAWVGVVGHQLMEWYSQNRFCGKCGAPTHEKADERAIACTSCSNVLYPKISPAIIVAIVCNNKILLAHNSNFRNNWYSLVAGYVDVGESLEEAVAREVKEEVGLDVRNIRYFKSQPWPFSGSMMIGFTAEADETQPVCPDNKEITSAQWFTRGNLPNHPPTISIAGELIELFEQGKI
ncbi:MAG: NAD(+) diphosphatase [Bacteroidales bacterium]|nr:NAD(+) diphosphatase [Bacteroidales bacterium]MBN2748078.1 NAD(+) diphosphatase [Bacteroidales bacterium]